MEGLLLWKKLNGTFPHIASVVFYASIHMYKGSKMHARYPGFVQSQEFSKKYGSLQTSFPDLEKVWKIEIKPGKKLKEVWNFFPFYNKCLIIE